MSQSLHQFIDVIAKKNPGQPEFMQAVTEVIESLWPFIEKIRATHSKACWNASANRNA